jgi:hypothetical protein
MGNAEVTIEDGSSSSKTAMPSQSVKMDLKDSIHRSHAVACAAVWLRCGGAAG